MSYGQLTTEMLDAIRPYVEGKRVIDLGAGDGRKARFLVRYGASHVTCVDKNLMPYQFAGQNIQWHERTYFYDLVCNPNCPEYDVAFVSWPVNYRQPGLVELCERAKVVIYLGCNYNGSACAFREFYQHLVGRELLDEHMTSRNALIIVGDKLEQPRTPTFEEDCGLSWGAMRTWAGP
jgi:hypothetical protein